jgi:hypothetical protein
MGGSTLSLILCSLYVYTEVLIIIEDRWIESDKTIFD